MQDIPFERLGIPTDMRKHVEPEAPAGVRLAAANGMVPTTPDILIPMLYVLASDGNARIRDAAIKTLQEIPSDKVVAAISQNTHSKVLELLATLRGEEQDIATRIMSIRNANDRTAVILAERAGPELCERIAFNQERLLITPQVFVALHANPSCTDAQLEKAAAFLRMHRSMPEVPAIRPFLDVPAPPPEEAPPEMDLEAEIEAALRGEQSSYLQARTEQALKMFDLDQVGGGDDLLASFKFDFKDDMSDFSLDMMADTDRMSREEVLSIEKRIAAMSVGQRIKLAYLGNKETRQILVRDRNKLVSVAVVRSGRCSDGEIASMAGNRNLHDDVLREVATNPEWTRKYPVRVALVGNPKTPVSVAVSMVMGLQKRDLAELSRNHNVSSVVTQLARRLYKQKYKSD